MTDAAKLSHPSRWPHLCTGSVVLYNLAAGGVAPSRVEERVAWSLPGAPAGDLNELLRLWEGSSHRGMGMGKSTRPALLFCTTFEAWLIGVGMRGTPPQVRSIYFNVRVAHDLPVNLLFRTSLLVGSGNDRTRSLQLPSNVAQLPVMDGTAAGYFFSPSLRAVC